MENKMNRFLHMYKKKTQRNGEWIQKRDPLS